jgi:phytanoyl-CoA hydroxylase
VRSSSKIQPAASDIEFFQQSGYAVFRNFVVAEEAARIRSNIRRFLSDIVPGQSPVEIYYEDIDRSETCKQIQHLENHGSNFASLMFNSRFESLAKDLLGEPVRGKNLQYFNKSSQHSLPTPPHQDGHYFMLSPCRALTMWLALDSVDEETGCLRVQPGSHLHGLRSHSASGTLGFSQCISDYPNDQERQQEVALPAEPGDLLVHDAMTIHCANRNRSSNRDRQALGFIYYGSSAKEDVEAHQSYQRQLVKQLRTAGKI